MFTVEYYESPDGDVPFLEWLDEFTDDKTVTRIFGRIRRVQLGILGDHKPVGEGVWELRLNFGPGYRVYYAQVGLRAVLLVGGGSKSTQKQDIRRAHRHIAEYKRRDP